MMEVSRSSQEEGIPRDSAISKKVLLVALRPHWDLTKS